MFSESYELFGPILQKVNRSRPVGSATASVLNFVYNTDTAIGIEATLGKGDPIMRDISFRKAFAAAFLLFTWSFSSGFAQEIISKVPELSVAGLKLGDRVSGKAFLGIYQARTDEDDLPKYYFYNGQGTTVMKITAASVEDPYFVTEIEVFKVGDWYQKRHFFLKDLGHFVTESGIFIGFRQKAGNLALPLIVGVPNVGRSNIIGPNDVIRRKGEPDNRAVKDNEEAFDYSVNSVTVGEAQHRYTAHYRFYKRELTRFILKIEPQAKPEIAKTKQ